MPRTATCQFRANKQKSELLVKADQIDANKVKSSLVQEASEKERERENMKFDLSEILKQKKSQIDPWNSNSHVGKLFLGPFNCSLNDIRV